MKNVKLTIEYDGTNFYGWQRQKYGRTVQEEIEKALKKIIKKEVKINGSGRTDAGVHALGQVANFEEEFSIPVEKIPVALNSVLPDDIAIKKAVEVSKDFHARYSAVGKKYIYKIYNGPLRSPLLRNYTYFVKDYLNKEDMKKATKFFIGEHDFKGFMASGSQVKDTVRTIYDLSIEEQDCIIRIEVKGNGFLYNMVRIIAGTLVDIGKGKINIEDLSEIIQSCKRERAGHTAPPQGLYLAEVYYEKTIIP
ncbi:tRNA pseudouridine(38-40) synthase TruA [Crassaminicella thermophila]|uniref:tRNA pseudouridine synthase A n=1 Tax=Crassaminicella thermophila TaxID=2599308 RepID=A0A5C0SAK9_CRATE|nr:tRNA pseudouridine(38-40) synthase TruA [Crassaminicella thermophila]QEK11201.1 tRNA pseudouridine(38-40) synthase TruA [Crassaminicella thermophila]